MPTLSSFYALYTDGSPLNDTFERPGGVQVTLTEVSPLVLPAPDDQLFGPQARALPAFPVRRQFLLGLRREVRGPAGDFFDLARQVVLDATRGVRGVGLDVLRLWPFVLQDAEEALPSDQLAEDLFSVGFSDQGEHGYRAETFGLAKLGQREVAFAFRGEDLLEEAALLCGHLADWLLEHGRRVGDAQSMAFGFDRLTFFAAEGPGAEGPFRLWHSPLIQRLLPAELFPGVGVLEVLSHDEGAPPSGRHDLTVALGRALDQRQLLEELDLPGDSPHAASLARVVGPVRELKGVSAWREAHADSRDSGWRLRAAGGAAPEALVALGEVARLVPGLVRYLALPEGVRLSWDDQGHLTVDSHRARAEQAGGASDDFDE